MSKVSPDKMGIGGSVNALVRYVGQAMGIAISNVFLYGVMSVKLGKRVTNFAEKNSAMFVVTYVKTQKMLLKN